MCTHTHTKKNVPRSPGGELLQPFDGRAGVCISQMRSRAPMCPVVAVVVVGVFFFACACECACDGSLHAGKLSVTGNWALNYKGYRQNHVHQAEEGRTRAEPSLPARRAAAPLFIPSHSFSYSTKEMEIVFCV